MSVVLVDFRSYETFHFVGVCSQTNLGNMVADVQMQWSS